MLTLTGLNPSRRFTSNLCNLSDSQPSSRPDFSHPFLSSIDLLQQIHQRHASESLIFLTGSSLACYRFQGLLAVSLSHSRFGNVAWISDLLLKTEPLFYFVLWFRLISCFNPVDLRCLSVLSYPRFFVEHIKHLLFIFSALRSWELFILREVFYTLSQTFHGFSFRARLALFVLLCSVSVNIYFFFCILGVYKSIERFRLCSDPSIFSWNKI